MRRIITGHNKNGKSVVMHDGPPARSIGEDVEYSRDLEYRINPIYKRF